MPQVPVKRWIAWTGALRFDQRIEFNEGDVGLANGISTLEAANLNPTTQDMIKRFGGSTSPTIPWPEDDTQGDNDADRFERLEVLIKRTMERMTKSGERKRGGKGDSSAGLSGSGGGGGSGEGGEGKGDSSA